MLRISTKELRLGMHVRKLGASWLQHPFLRNSFLLTDPNDLKAIVDAGIEEVWVDSKSIAATSKAEPIVAAIANHQDIQVSKRDETTSMDEEVLRARKICLSAKEQVTSIFRDVRLGKAIDPSITLPLVQEIAASVQRNASALISVARLKTHDDYTYLHSVAVCALMLSLARQLNLSEPQVVLAGHAGLMHDLGKAKMPLAVLNKRGKLTDAEFEVMKLHPQAGAELLRVSGACEEVQDVALHHHEKIDGQGYPYGLKGEEISLLSRMGAVCDVYDAVTSERPYKSAWDPAGAIARMAKWDGHFDKSVFNAFVKTVGIYPVGSLVRLASECLAIVIEPGEKSLLKPKVRAFFSVRSKKTIPEQTIDLASPGCTDSIVGLEEPSRWGFKKFRNLDDLWLK